MANGSMRDALSLLDRLISVGIEPLHTDLLAQYLGQPDAEKVYILVKAVGDSDGAATLEALDQLLVSGLSEIQVVDALIDCLRDLMVLKASGDQTRLVILTEDQRNMAVQLARAFDTPGLVYQITALEKLRWTVKNSDSPRTLLEAALLRFALSEHFLGVDALIGHLQGRSPSSVKKKHITKDPPTHTPSIPVSEAQVSHIDEIITQWPQILNTLTERLGSGTASLLMNARPLTLINGTLTLQFESSAYHQKQMCESNGRLEQIQHILSEYLGVPTKVLLQVAEGNQGQQAGQDNDHAAQRQRRNELLNDPAVKTVLRGLDATVTGIEQE
jgi:DNA polymerase III gamma/tau subunit